MPGLGRILQTAEAVQRDWLMTRAELEAQGLGRLAADVERFRQSLTIQLTAQERTVAKIGHMERSQMRLGFER